MTDEQIFKIAYEITEQYMSLDSCDPKANEAMLPKKVESILRALAADARHEGSAIDRAAAELVAIWNEFECPIGLEARLPEPLQALYDWACKWYDKSIGECRHDFQHLDTTYRHEIEGYNNKYIRTDMYYCRKCLLEKELRKEAHSREAPEWYKP